MESEGNRARILGKESFGEERCNLFMIECEDAIVVYQRRNVRGSAAMAPRSYFPNIGCGDVGVCPVAFGSANRGFEGA